MAIVKSAVFSSNNNIGDYYRKNRRPTTNMNTNKPPLFDGSGNDKGGGPLTTNNIHNRRRTFDDEEEEQQQQSRNLSIMSQENSGDRFANLPVPSFQERQHFNASALSSLLSNSDCNRNALSVLTQRDNQFGRSHNEHYYKQCSSRDNNNKNYRQQQQQEPLEMVAGSEEEMLLVLNRHEEANNKRQYQEFDSSRREDKLFGSGERGGRLLEQNNFDHLYKSACFAPMPNRGNLQQPTAANNLDYNNCSSFGQQIISIGSSGGDALPAERLFEIEQASVAYRHHREEEREKEAGEEKRQPLQIMNYFLRTWNCTHSAHDAINKLQVSLKQQYTL